MLYNKISRNFFGLGFPVRLRRPISKDIITLIPKKFFIPGKNLSFIRKEFSNIAIAEQEFFFDLVLEIKSLKLIKKIPFYRVYKYLKNYRIL